MIVKRSSTVTYFNCFVQKYQYLIEKILYFLSLLYDHNPLSLGKNDLHRRKFPLNILSDCHVHTSFSGDSSASPESVIEHALDLHMAHLCLTDHMDYDYVEDGLCFEFDPKLYFQQLTALRSRYQDRIDLNIGIELGLQPYLNKRHHNLIFSYPFDFVIGSIHLVNGKDPYYPSYFEGREETEGYMEYFECCLQNLEAYCNFDTLGHLDYVVRYGPNQNRDYHYAQYQEILDAILKYLVKKDIGLEVNTGGFKYGLGTTNPCPEIIRRYKELGGKIITLGSDAHEPNYLAYEFGRAAELIRSCGFSSYFIFKNRIPTELPL